MRFQMTIDLHRRSHRTVQQVAGALHDGIHVNLFDPQTLPAREGEQILCQAGTPLGGAASVCDMTQHPIGSATAEPHFR